jgi:hypothetical protein
MYHENRCIHEQSTARWDALLAGLTCRVHTLLRLAPLAVALRAAVRQLCEGVAPGVRCARAPSPRAHARSARASRSRKRWSNRAGIRLCSEGWWRMERACYAIALRVRRASAPSPARGRRERALSPREHKASECTKSGVPSSDPTAAPVLACARNVLVEVSVRARPARAPSSARRRAWRAEAGARRHIVLAPEKRGKPQKR